MNKLSNNHNKWLMNTAIFVLVSFLASGAIPYFINEGIIIEGTIITRGLFVVVRYFVFLSIALYSWVTVKSIILFKGVTRYLRIIEITSILIIAQYFNPIRTEFASNLSLIIVIAVGISVIATDVCIFIIRKKTGVLNIDDDTIQNERINSDSTKNSNSVKNGKKPVDPIGVWFIFIMLVSFYDIQNDNIASYILLSFVNLFILQQYITITKQTKKNTWLLSILTVLLISLVITLLQVFNTFFSNDKLLYCFMLFLPTLYLYPNIVKRTNMKAWEHTLDPLKTEIEK